MKNKVTVQINGHDYTLVGDNTEQLKHVANYVDEEIQQVKEHATGLNPLAVSILASLNITKLLFKCSQQHDDLTKELEHLKETMVKPSEEAYKKEQQMNEKLEQKDVEVIEKQYKIEELQNKSKEQEEKIINLTKTNEEMEKELEKYKSEVEKLKAELDEAYQSDNAAKNILDSWQNKNYELQMKCEQLETRLKNIEETL